MSQLPKKVNLAGTIYTVSSGSLKLQEWTRFKDVVLLTFDEKFTGNGSIGPTESPKPFRSVSHLLTALDEPVGDGPKVLLFLPRHWRGTLESILINHD